MLPWAVCDSARGLTCLLVLLAAISRHCILPIADSVISDPWSAIFGQWLALVSFVIEIACRVDIVTIIVYAIYIQP